MFVHPDFEGLKVIRGGKDGGREGVPVSWSHGDKRISEWSGSALFQFDRERVLEIGGTAFLCELMKMGSYPEIYLESC